MKKIGLFLFFVAVGTVSLLAQTRGNDTDSRQIREILNGGNFKINIQNVINNPKSTTAIYSKHSIEVVGDTIKADLPYFYRNDNPQTATETNVKIDTSIKKHRPKHNHRQTAIHHTHKCTVRRIQHRNSQRQGWQHCRLQRTIRYGEIINKQTKNIFLTTKINFE